MLRVGLTGELGSGKSTVARLLGEHGAVVLNSDEMGRALMQPGEPVFAAIVEAFGPGVLASDGTLDRKALAGLAFDPDRPRVEELNRLIHPAVLAAQERQLAELAKTRPDAIAVVESALIFTTPHGVGAEPWRSRFDTVVIVTAPDEVKIRRFVERVAGGRPLSGDERKALAQDAERRLAAQRIPAERLRESRVLRNDGDLGSLERETERLWAALQVFDKEVGIRVPSTP